MQVQGQPAMLASADNLAATGHFALGLVVQAHPCYQGPVLARPDIDSLIWHALAHYGLSQLCCCSDKLCSSCMYLLYVPCPADQLP